MGTQIIEIGSNLTAVRGPGWATEAAKGLQAIIKHMTHAHGQVVLDYSRAKVFTKAGAPSNGTTGDSPGSDLCYIIDITALDLYLVHTWTAKNSFTVVKIIE